MLKLVLIFYTDLEAEFTKTIFLGENEESIFTTDVFTQKSFLLLFRLFIILFFVIH